MRQGVVTSIADIANRSNNVLEHRLLTEYLRNTAPSSDYRRKLEAYAASQNALDDGRKDEAYQHLDNLFQMRAYKSIIKFVESNQSALPRKDTAQILCATAVHLWAEHKTTSCEHRRRKAVERLNTCLGKLKELSEYVA